MNCSEFNEMLDLYIDGELDKDISVELKGHAAGCAQCANALHAAMQLKDFLSHIDDEVSVPLTAQAAWRGAVKAEARRRKVRFISRAAGAVAAVAVMAIGITAMVRMPAPTATQIVNAGDSNVRSVAFVETDGVAENTALETAEPAPRSVAGQNPIQRVVKVENIDSAYAYLKDIAAEYEMTIQSEELSENSAKIHLSVSGESIDAFLSAVDHLGTAEGDAISAEDAEKSGIVVVLTNA